MIAPTEFYTSPTQLVPTVSLLVATSIGSIGSLRAIDPYKASGVTAASYRSSFATDNPYYVGATQPSARYDVPVAMDFAERVSSEIVDAPKIALDVLNQHFWELI